MKTIKHTADTRGEANHGWLKSHHSFSFANYFNQDRMNFGMLRVLNDDEVSGGKGFGKHPHKNMEIISIPLSGDLEHQDSMGNTTVIKEGDIQVMSAGTGVMHSEYNKNKDQAVKFLQIWVIPNQENVEPRYDQISTLDLKKENEWYQILSPHKEDQGVWIHQQAYFSMGDFTQPTSLTYDLKDAKNGVYIFVLEGNLKVETEDLRRRDALGIWETDSIEVKAEAHTKVLLMEIPMT
ncbi:pirin family protein [Mesonia sp. K4-1]|uniref:pirin family protein n=1 Tax=Mesonia sp. K4-1 TaxID=2602760 RepID=UPI0011CAB861|nr:pirin family protein [Mesonia sp. K4-1]TXK75679.1 pirin family protein [Mesonia sp. K4-1]